LDIAHLKKFKQILESNVLEHSVETKAFDGHPVEYPQNIYWQIILKDE